MSKTGTTVRLVWSGMILHLGLWAAWHVPAYLGAAHHYTMIEAAIRTGALSVACGLAMWLNLEIAGEYRGTPWLRLAWASLGLSAGFMILRHLSESHLIDLIFAGYTRSEWHGLLQHLAIVPANGFLLLGLLAMWHAYRRVGLGFGVRRSDVGVLLLILGLMVALLLFREGLSEARSRLQVARYLQQAGLVLLTLSAMMGVILQRAAREMGGGRLAVALWFLTLYTSLRGVLVLTQAWFRLVSPEMNMPLSSAALYLDICWQAAPWLATLAAACRVDLTLYAARELAQYRGLGGERTAFTA